MNLQKKIKKLEKEIIKLKLENLKLKLELHELNTEWVHPRSCLHNDDPWTHLKP